MPSARKYVSLRDAADQLGVTERTIRNFISRGKLRGYRVGTKIVRVDQAELDDLVRPIPTVGGGRGAA